MPTSTDFEQTGRDANILNNYFYEEPPLLDENEYGRLGKLILKLIQEGGGGTTIKYGGRVDSVEDLPETGEPNQFYLVGLEDSENFDEYIWAEVEGGTGHWDRLGSVSIIIDDHLDPNSTNPVQNGIVAAAFTAVNNAINAVNTALASKADKTEIPDISHKLEQSAIAAEYDPTATYADGTYVTLDGELYRIDSVNGQALPMGENLLVTYADRLKNSTYGHQNSRYWESYGDPGLMTNNDNMYISGSIPIKQNTAYRIYESGWSVLDSRYYALAMFTNGTNSQVYARVFVYGSNGAAASATVSSGSYQYISMSMPKNEVLAAQYSIYELSAHKFVKVTVADELADKADVFTTDATPTASSTNPVQSGGVYTALGNKLDIASIDDVLSTVSENPVQNKVVTQKINEIMEIIEDKTIIYGWSVNPNESNPATAVEYLADAVGKTPAAMDSTEFNYGSWANAFFMPKPCMLKFDGTVDYYLDPNDYSKKLDGTASDIGDLSYGGNAMMEWPLIWYKFESGTAEGEGRFYCSNKQVDKSYKCWCNVNSENDVIEHFYTPIYDGIIRDNKMRSLSGFRLTPTLAAIPEYNNTATYAVGALTKVSGTAYTCIAPISTAEEFDSSKWEEITPNNSGSTTGQQEVNAATANNTTSTVEWYTEVLSDRMLISALLILMGKNLDDQAVLGRGLDTGGQSAKEAYVTGTLDNKGLFWGVTANGNSAVKVFGMENFYACNWRRTAGLIGTTVDGVAKYAYKLTYGTADGSTAAAYGSASTGYLIADTTRPSTNNYVEKMKIGKHGVLPVLVSSTATSSTYWGVYFYTGTGYALFGGNSYTGQNVGSLVVNLNNGFSSSYWSFGAALSCKPKKAV